MEHHTDFANYALNRIWLLTWITFLEKFRKKREGVGKECVKKLWHTSSPAEAWRIASGTEVGKKWWPQLLKSSSNGFPTCKKDMCKSQN